MEIKEPTEILLEFKQNPLKTTASLGGETIWLDVALSQLDAYYEAKFLGMLPEEKESPKGKGCRCGAHGDCECGCDADWTDNDSWNACLTQIKQEIKRK